MPVKCIELNFGKPSCSDDDTLTHWALGWIYYSNVSWGEQLRSSCYSWGSKSLELHVKLVYRLIVGFLGWFGWFDCVQFTLLIFYMICVLSFLSSFRFLFLFYFCFLFEILWVYLLQTLTRPHSSTWGNRDSYDSELDLKIVFFALLKDEQSLSVGVFVWVLT